MQDQIVILSAVRTPMGSFLGELKTESANLLGSIAIREAVQRAQIERDQVDEVFMGCVLSAGQGQAPARQAALKAGLSQSTAATTINKMCGSGLQSIFFAQQLLHMKHSQYVVAGGMESMSNAPYLLDRARAGYRMGHHKIIDHMFVDGLEDAYQSGRLMGTFAQECADLYQFTREQQDQFAIASLKRARQAIQHGYFKDEIAAVSLKQKSQHLSIEQDEQPLKAKLDKIPLLKPAFSVEGTITAANSSSISDGAAALVISTLAHSEKMKIAPLAKIVGQAVYAGEPGLFATAPVYAIKKLLQQCQWNVNDVDLFEINEAFAVVPMIAMQELSIPHEKINIHGGACALGHPLGASGARIVVTLIHALKQQGLSRGVAAICIGGGEALAIAIECFN